MKKPVNGFVKASMQAHAAAQYKLARLYAEGNGVPLDNEFAYIWYSVGADSST